MGKIYYIMGKSSSGKDTIYKRLLNDYPGFHTIVLYTTRPARDGEQDGVEYHFVDEQCLDEMRKQNKVIEARSYHTKCGVWTYFTADDGQIDLNSRNYLVIGTLESYRALRAYFGKERLIPVYIEVDDGLRLERALMRERQQKEPKYAEMCRRYLADEEDFSEENLTAAQISVRFRNESLEECMKEIKNYITCSF